MESTKERQRNGRGQTAKGEGVRWKSLADLMKLAGMDNERLGASVGVGARTVEQWLYAEFVPGTNRIAAVARALASELARLRKKPGRFPEVLAQLMDDLPESRRAARRETLDTRFSSSSKVN